MKKIISIIWKNLLLIFRSRISALIMLFGPLLIMLVVGLALSSTGAVHINVGHYSSDYNELTNSFIKVLGDKNYTLTGFKDAEDCRMAIISGNVHICVIFPDDFELRNDRVSEIVFLVDNSKISFYQTVIDSIERDFNERALELSMGLTQELLDKLNETQGSIANKSDTIKNLKDENKVIRDDVKKISDEVKDLDLNFDYGSLSLDDLDEGVDDLSDSIEDIRSIAEDAIEEAEDLIDNLDEEIEDLDLNGSAEDNLLDLLNDTGDILIDLKKDLNDSRDINTSELEGLIGTLKKELQGVDNKFSIASKARDQSVDKIKNINSRLDQSLSKILSVEETFNSIYANIAGTKITNLEAITKPIEKRVEPVVIDEAESQLNFYFPYLVVLLIMFIGLMLSSTLVIMEKTSRAHFRNFVTPTSDLTFIFGTYVTTMVIMVVQLIIVLSIYALYFEEDIITNFKSTFLVLFLLTSLFTLIGMVIGNLFNTEETGTLASISIGSILLFVSDLVFPIEMMPDYIAGIARLYNPFVIGTEILRKTMVYRTSAGNLGNDLYLILIYLTTIFLVVLLSHKLMKRTYLLQWGGYIARRKLRIQKQISLEGELLSKYANIDEKDYFKAKDGKSIPSLAELTDHIKSLDEELYKEYVTEERNDISEWIKNVLKNEHLADNIQKAKNKKAMIKALESGMKTYEKLSHKHSDKNKRD